SLTVDLGAGTTVDYLSPGHVTDAAPVSQQATAKRAVAAVNGDFFDINNSDAPEGVGVESGKVVKSAETGHNRVIGIDAAGVGRVMQVFFEGKVTLPNGTSRAGPVARVGGRSLSRTWSRGLLGFHSWCSGRL
ncbi:hypothetical protein ACFQ1S_14970, partial [Kibdelosporangium lantanae]